LCACGCVGMCVCLCVFARTCVGEWLRVWLCVREWVCVCSHGFVCALACLRVRVCVCGWACVGICTCIIVAVLVVAVAAAVAAAVVVVPVDRVVNTRDSTDEVGAGAHTTFTLTIGCPCWLLWKYLCDRLTVRVPTWFSYFAHYTHKEISLRGRLKRCIPNINHSSTDATSLEYGSSARGLTNTPTTLQGNIHTTPYGEIFTHHPTVSTEGGKYIITLRGAHLFCQLLS
jgi:hypothetical protein